MKSPNEINNIGGQKAINGEEVEKYPAPKHGIWYLMAFWGAAMLMRHHMGMGALPPAMMQYIHTNGEPPQQVFLCLFVGLVVMTIAHFMLDMGSNMVEMNSEQEDAVQGNGTLGLFNGLVGLGISFTLGQYNYMWLAFFVTALFAGFAVLLTLSTMRQVGFWRMLRCLLWGVMICSFIARMTDRRKDG